MDSATESPPPPDTETSTTPAADETISRFEPPRTDEVLQSSYRPQSSTLLLFLGGFVFVALAVIAGYMYLLRPQPAHFRFSGEEAPEASPTPVQQATPPFQGISLKSDLPITADMLRVTSIALGDVHLTIVNGRRLAEGEWLKVKVGDDYGALRVTKIEDGVVHFAYGDKSIDSKLIVQSTAQTPH